MQRLSLANPPFRDGSLVQNQGRHRSRGFLDLNPSLLAHQYALVTDLPTAFRIKWRHIQDQFNFIALRRFCNQPIALQNRLHETLALQAIVADKLRRPETSREFRHRRPSRFLFKPAGFARAISLLFNGLVEPDLIERHPLLAAGLTDEIYRKPIRVIEFKHIRAA